MREWRDNDRAPYAVLNADPEVMEHFPSTLTPRAERRDGRSHDRPAGSDVASGCGRSSGVDTRQFIGFVGLAAPGWHGRRSRRASRSAGAWRKQHWGHGFAPEAALRRRWRAASSTSICRTTRSSASPPSQNVKSQRVMEKIGMTHRPGSRLRSSDGCRTGSSSGTSSTASIDRHWQARRGTIEAWRSSPCCTDPT